MVDKWFNSGVFVNQKGVINMDNHFGERLKLARKMAGLSMEGLSEKANSIVTKQAIDKYEKGKMQPTTEVLIALAKALNVKVEYFFRSSNVVLSMAAFRKSSKLSKKKEEMVKNNVLDLLERYLEIEELLDDKPRFENPLSINAVNDYSDIEKAAEELRKKWNLGESPIPCLIELLEDKGIKIIEVEIEGEFDGLSAYVDDIPIITVRKTDDGVRKRFTISHELAHILLPFPPDQHMNRQKEKICHSFAGAFLLPRNVIENELGEKRRRITLWELEKLKGTYGISIQAIMARANRLNIITNSAYKQFCININRYGWKKNEPGRYEGKECANRFKQLVLRAIAEQIVTYSRGAELLNASLSEITREVQFV